MLQVQLLVPLELRRAQRLLEECEESFASVGSLHGFLNVVGQLAHFLLLGVRELQLLLHIRAAGEGRFTGPGHAGGDGAGAGLEASPAPGDKCVRCWRILPEVGQEAAHPALCMRCTDAVDSGLCGQPAAAA